MDYNAVMGHVGSTPTYRTGGIMDYVLIVFTLVTLIPSSVMLYYSNKLNKNVKGLTKENKNLKNKMLIMSASSEIQRATMLDIKQILEDSKIRIKLLRKKNLELESKLLDNNKKNEAFSKMIEDMKN